MTGQGGVKPSRSARPRSIAGRWDPFCFGNQAILGERRRRLGELLETAGVTSLGDRRVLDVGCGSGGTMRDWLALGVSPHNLYGVDVLAHRLEEIARDHAKGVVCCADGRALPFPDDSFDLISTFTLFSSVADPGVARAIAAELRRVSDHDGRLLWYDLRYPSPRNPSVHAVGRGGVAGLFPGADIRLASVTLLPPVARRLHPKSASLYRWLAKAPPLRSHYLGVIRFPPPSAKR